jgi:sarcosine oxidase subunit beta
MPLALLKYGLSKTYDGPAYFARQPELKKNYDVIVIGAGGHGAAIAYYLAKNWGINNVALIEKGYLGGGNTARNTTIIRSNYLTPEGVKFYSESMKLFKELDRELDINLMYSERGHLTLAHSDSAIRTSRWRAEVNKHMGVDSELVYREEIAKICPQLNLSDDVRHPILGALYHPPGATARHDAVAWGYARAACNLGVELHQKTAVTGIIVEDGKVQGVQTDKGPVYAGKVVQAVAGSSSLVARMAEINLPIVTTPLQACVSEPVKPVLDTIIVSGSLHVYISQSSRGEFVMGGSTDNYPAYTSRSTLDFKEGLMAHMLELFPFMGEVRLMRQWAGMSDITPDFTPVMGLTPVENYYIDAGWGTWGFKATPVSGKRMAECVATNTQPSLIEPFKLSRFDDFSLVGEKGAASVGH